MDSKKIICKKGKIFKSTMKKDFILKDENIFGTIPLGELGMSTMAHHLNRWWHQVHGMEILCIGITIRY